MEKTIEQIAKKHFYVETMETRRIDDKDFYSVAIWSIEDALRDAYRAGLEDQADILQTYQTRIYHHAPEPIVQALDKAGHDVEAIEAILRSFRLQFNPEYIQQIVEYGSASKLH